MEWINIRVVDLQKTYKSKNAIALLSEELGLDYYSCTYEYALQNKGVFENCLMLLISYSDVLDCDEIIKMANAEIKTLVSLIIISERMEFSKKKYYYNLGVTAIICGKKLMMSQLRQYFNASIEEMRIINKLREMKIAIIDDSKFSLEVIKSYFTREEINKVDFFQEPEAVLRSAEEYDMYLIDLVMPGISGEEVIQTIRATKEDAIIIVITGYGDGTSIPNCMNLGADDFLLKPFDFKLFILRISTCLNQKQLKAENNEGIEKLYRLATRDTLTGLFNRSYFIESLNRRLIEMLRNSRTVSLLLVDIDHFKTVNDEYGHLKGDAVLKEISSILSSGLRSSDVVCRWGGEEFLIMLLDADIEEATKVAEKLRDSIENLKIQGIRKITASFGVTQCQKDESEEDAFKRIDNSLYLAKLTGRNKVVSNEEIYIYKCGLPVTIEWGPFFKSGHPLVDFEHNDLIALSNEIVQNCFVENNRTKLIQLYERLIDHIVIHFISEEKVLKDYHYERYEEHCQIHQGLVEKTMQMKVNLNEQSSDPINLAKYLIQDVVIGHIVKSDFDFFYLFEDCR